MNKIKDIIYNKSDIIIAILILAIAALIIFWRLGIILEYPKQLIGTLPLSLRNRNREHRLRLRITRRALLMIRRPMPELLTRMQARALLRKETLQARKGRPRQRRLLK